MPGRRRAIVIGASAGGVDALGQILPALPADFAASVLVVLHLAPDRPSLLAQIFGSSCAMQVKLAEDKEPIEHGVVYFAPPDYHLLVDHGPHVVLSTHPPERFSRPSIDALFETAAEVYRSRLWGVILTGNSEDGAAGLAAVNKLGGRTLVQSPDEARGPLMPAAALREVPSATVLPLSGIAQQLKRFPLWDAPVNQCERSNGPY